jgi:hypothetical protein
MAMTVMMALPVSLDPKAIMDPMVSAFIVFTIHEWFLHCISTVHINMAFFEIKKNPVTLAFIKMIIAHKRKPRRGRTSRPGRTPRTSRERWISRSER